MAKHINLSLDPIVAAQYGRQTDGRLDALESALSAAQSQARATRATATGGGASMATPEEAQDGYVANKAVSPASLSARTATESRTGLARLATIDEARLWPVDLAPGSDLEGTIMTPQRTMDLLQWFSPAVGIGRTAAQVADWNGTTQVGFYRANKSSTLNCPPSTADTFIGIVYDEADRSHGAGSDGPVHQVVEERFYDAGSDTFYSGMTWRRTRSFTGAWGPWVSDAATPDRAGAVELATSAEALTGTDATRAVTPAALKSVADTKSATGHGHALTDANMTGVLPVAQVPTIDIAAKTSGTLAVARGGTGATTAAAALTALGAAAAVHSHTATQVTDFSTAADARINTLVPAATDAVAGKSELATSAETQAGSDATRVVTPAGLSARTATITRTGLARLATADEAHLTPSALVPGSDLDNTIMTPRRTMELLEWFSPAVDMGRMAAKTSDWNTTKTSGFWAATGSTLNGPAASGRLVGVVYNTSTQGYGSGDTQPVFQDLAEFDSTTGDLVRRWTRIIPASGAPTAWVSSDATDVRRGLVELATSAEALAGTDTARAVTPAALKAVADTKAASGHGHALTDANMTGVLPVAQVPTLDLATKTSGTLTVARGGTGATTAAAALTALGAAPTTHGHALTDANMTGVLPVAQVPTIDIATKTSGNLPASRVTGIPGASPAGLVSAFAGAAAPTGWLLCDGAAVSRTTYADLFAAIGTTYGAGNGTSTFTLPNLKGRVPVGLDATQTEFATLGKTGGTKDETLTIAQTAPHTHEISVNGVDVGYGNTSAGAGSGYGGFVNPGQDIKATSAGGGQPHNNLQPYAVLNYIIKI